jgi:hypothetical protein
MSGSGEGVGSALVLFLSFYYRLCEGVNMPTIFVAKGCVFVGYFSFCPRLGA